MNYARNQNGKLYAAAQSVYFGGLEWIRCERSNLPRNYVAAETIPPLPEGWQRVEIEGPSGARYG